MVQKLNKNRYLFWGFQTLTFIIMFVWNLMTPLYADDLEPSKYQNLGMILQQTKLDYFGWNGRIVGQTLFRILSVGDHQVVAMLNALAFVALVWLMYLLSLKRKGGQHNNLGYIILVLTTTLLIPDFGQTVLWKAGAGNYLWIGVLNLLFIYLFTSKTFLTTRKLSLTTFLQTLFFYSVALLAGIGNENTSGGTLILVLIYLGVLFCQKAPFVLNRSLAVVINLIGYLILVLSPAAKIRTLATFGKEYYDVPVIVRALKGLLKINETVMTTYLPLLAALVLLALLRYNTKKDRYLFAGLAWTLAGGAIIYALALSPMGQEGGRSFFGGIIYLIIGLFLLAPTGIQNTSSRRFAKQLCITVILMWSFLTLPAGFYDSFKSSQAINERYEKIKSQAKQARTNGKAIAVSSLTYEPMTKYSVNLSFDGYH
ncbi:DUF3329 domain-containing protein [Ligilactobacillus murinus]|uniref:Uncharacterized protein n=1 Tax=Ligilactobacillus murinus TaxID=1622 RepID=A0A4Q2AX52_9LACO|nr:DUF6056 family protein [Ligilactobacillus murinus]NBH40602.1 hypothetical protein [Ligilactobacillus murinus]NBH85236.1 hypothetical protein [Lachnospiraceae bacterium]RII81054.1 hypothetical protein D1870_03190 [Ligilactobacillus murinus]RXV74903.1 hypothetical protein D6C19_03545 [Ligilactobacillus murinus]